MAQVFPTSAPAWAVPVVRSLVFKTGIGQGRDGTEQRWPLTPGVESWTLPYPHLTVSQRDTLLALFETCKGSYDQTVSLSFNGTNYTGLSFDADTLAFTEATPNKISGTVKLTTVARAADAGTLATDFPVLVTGARVQLPYTLSRAFDTVSVRTEGNRYASARRNASLHTWTAGGTAVTDSEAQAIWDMFRLAGGRWQPFGFTDPDSLTRYAKCRFGSDSLSWQINGPNNNSITATIQELV